MPTRFKKEIIKGCSLLTTRTGTTTTTTPEDDQTTIAVKEIEQMLRNIGVFGDRGVTHDDVELIVSEHSTTNTTSYNTEGQTIHANQILMQLL
mmetsp:Transcript_54181/g.60504  ORF Transcript_54181/g.60504 Transcript_54181/m.60504 type:complete len:93 (-) Transcript_54181:26-304(-)